MEPLGDALKPALERIREMQKGRKYTANPCYNQDITTPDSDASRLTDDNLIGSNSRDALREPSLASGVVIGPEEK